MADKMEPATVQQRHQLWDLFREWPALLEAHPDLHAAVDGLPASSGNPAVSYEPVSSLGSVTVRDALAANLTGLAGLRAAKRCVLSDIKHGGDGA